MASPTPIYTAAVAQAAGQAQPLPQPSSRHARRSRPASVTPLYPNVAVSPGAAPATATTAAPRRRSLPGGWTLVLLPPARSPGTVRTVPLGRRHAVVPVLVAAILLGSVAYTAGRLGMWRHQTLVAPEVTWLQERVRDAEARASTMGDSLAMLQAQVASLTATVETRRAAQRASAAVAARAGAMATEGVVLPVLGRITSRFAPGRVHPILRMRRPHRGLDIAAPAGTTITAPAAGRVTKVARELAYGLVVHVDHGGGMTTRYAHLRSANVSVGQVVDEGEPIATVGSTGLSTGPHLHYEVRVRGDAVDPLRVPVQSHGL
ncbi:MAG TPA: M23 family metallopeptidase [Gemmatimonadales bacterium]